MAVVNRWVFGDTVANLLAVLIPGYLGLAGDTRFEARIRVAQRVRAVAQADVLSTLTDDLAASLRRLTESSLSPP
jgi:hypothetical protein